MKLTEFTSLLDQNPDAELQFLLPDGQIAVHSHVTEVGRVDRLFIDCGGRPRRISNCNVQMWAYSDTEHRLSPAKLSAIFAKANPMFGGEDLSVEIEFEQGVISQYPVTSGAIGEGKLTFRLELKHTACLALELCAPVLEEASCCGGTSGGCS